MPDGPRQQKGLAAMSVQIEQRFRDGRLATEWKRRGRSGTVRRRLRRDGLVVEEAAVMPEQMGRRPRWLPWDEDSGMCTTGISGISGREQFRKKKNELDSRR